MKIKGGDKKCREEEVQDLEEVLGLALDPEEVWEWATLIHSAGISRGSPEGGGQECMDQQLQLQGRTRCHIMAIRILTGGG